MTQKKAKPKAKSDLSHIAEGLRPLAIEVAELVPDPANARKHDEKNIAAIRGSLAQFGQRKPLIVQQQGMIVRAGNGTLQAAISLGWTHVAAIVVDEDNASAISFAIADNRTAELAEWDDSVLAQLLHEVEVSDEDLQEMFAELATAQELFTGDEPEPNGDGEECQPRTLAERFLVPPFSVLDARQGYWQERKRMWLALGIQSEIGRGGRARSNGDAQRPDATQNSVCPGGSPRPAMKLKNGRTTRGDGKGRELTARIGHGVN